MIIVNTPDIPNKKIKEVHGIARGSTVRARNVGRDIFASLKNIVGGEISEYTRLQAESREYQWKKHINNRSWWKYWLRISKAMFKISTFSFSYDGYKRIKSI